MYLHNDDEVFVELIEAAAEKMDLPPIYIEKDYWVTNALKHLSQSQYLDKAIFKGGTSLSKAHKLIARFSEDIDLAILSENLGDSPRKKLIRNIEKTVTTGLKYIQNDKRESKGSKFRRTVYQYPRIIRENNFGQGSSELLVELNAFTKPEPYKTLELQSLIAEMLIDNNKEEYIEQYNLQSFSINVLSVGRTLVEKILRVIKDSYHSDPIGELSNHIRHLYDIDSILRQDEYHNFVLSTDFKLSIQKCIEDEKHGEFKSVECLDKPLADAPLFSNFNQWRKQLEPVYIGIFSDFVYEQLPSITSIEQSLMFLRDNLDSSTGK